MLRDKCGIKSISPWPGVDARRPAEPVPDRPEGSAEPAGGGAPGRGEDPPGIQRPAGPVRTRLPTKRVTNERRRSTSCGGSE